MKGESLGVVLDVSGSMQRYLPSLRKEINSQFSGAQYLEVVGCLLEPSDFNPREIEPSNARNPNSRDSVMNSFRELVEIHKVDSIYWFCDLQDERTPEALKELRYIVNPSNSRFPRVHLYIRSTDEGPDRELIDIIKISKGAYETRR